MSGRGRFVFKFAFSLFFSLLLIQMLAKIMRYLQKGLRTPCKIITSTWDQLQMSPTHVTCTWAFMRLDKQHSSAGDDLANMENCMNHWFYQEIVARLVGWWKTIWMQKIFEEMRTHLVYDSRLVRARLACLTCHSWKYFLVKYFLALAANNIWTLMLLWWAAGSNWEMLSVRVAQVWVLMSRAVLIMLTPAHDHTLHHHTHITTYKAGCPCVPLLSSIVANRTDCGELVKCSCL